MNSFKFIADVNVSPQTVLDLKKAGYDIIRSSEVLPANAKDIEQPRSPRLAREQGDSLETPID